MSARLRFSPLAAAIALALIPVVALGVLLGPLRHAAPSRPAAAATATPTPTASPKPTPTPPRLAQLAAADRLDVGAPHAYGRIDVVGYSHLDDVALTGYRMVATAPAMPSALPVWRLRGFVAVDTAPLAARLGVTAAATPGAFGARGSTGIDAGNADVWAGSGSDSTMFSSTIRPSDDASAIAALSQVLADLGLLPQDADATAMAYNGAQPRQWGVSFTRRAILGVPVGHGFWDDGVASASVTEVGGISRLYVHEPSIDGGSVYPLRTWREAWSDVSRGHWWDECCDVNTGGGMMPASLFHADKVALVYREVGTPAAYLMPCYEFTDNTLKLDLFVPALRLSDLSEPGGFRLVEPGSGIG